MKKKGILWKIIWCMALSTLPVLGLHIISKELNRRPGNFIRLFPPHPTTPEYIIDLKYNSYYMAGISKPFIFFGNATNPLHLLKFDYSSLDTTHLKLTIPNIKSAPGRSKVHVLDSTLFLTNGNTPLILKGSLSNLTLKPIDTTTYFMSAQLGSTNRIFLKTYDGNTSHLAYKDFVHDTLQFATSLLEKQVDGIFCVDGQLLYEPQQHRLIYVYRYRNEFMLTDSLLVPYYKKKTIDTISKATIKLVVLDNGQTQLAKPPLVVNKSAAVDRERLYIHSGQRAANEKVNAFNNYSVIDVYNMVNGAYNSSFYLPNFKSYKLHEFRIHQQKLYALYDHFLVIYQLNFEKQAPV